MLHASVNFSRANGELTRPSAMVNILKYHNYHDWEIDARIRNIENG